MHLQDLILDLFHHPQGRTTMVLYGIQMASELCNQNNIKCPFYLNLLKAMTHSSARDVRRACIQHLRAPFSQVSLIMLGKRLRDKDEEIRRQAYMKLARCQITIEAYPSQEQRMLIIKEGLTDPSPGVREACFEFLKPTMTILVEEGGNPNEEGSELVQKSVVIDDLSYLFKLIDCRQMFIKEYYIQIPFIIMRFVFGIAGEDDLQVANYLEKVLKKLKSKAGCLETEEEDQEMNEVTFEELLFLRIAYEFTKMYRSDRSQEFLDHLDKIALSFEEYSQIFEYLLNHHSSALSSGQQPDRLLFAEWVKFSLQLAIEDEVTRRNLVSLMFDYVGQVGHSYRDYQHLLKYGRMMIRDCDPRSVDLAVDGGGSGAAEMDLGDVEVGQDQQVIEIEIREFRDHLGENGKRDINEYCKPFSFESLVVDSDDVCRIAVIVARKLLDARIDEFSLSMLQAISDIREPLDDEELPPMGIDGGISDEPLLLSFKKQKDLIYRKMEQKLDQVNELVAADDYSFSDLNKIMAKVKHYVALIEELNLKEKLSFKRALNLCLILLKQCRADVNDQNLISICETLIAPTIQSKDKDNMLLAIECIGLLCLLDKELFQNYSKIFQTILTEDVQQSEDNQREKIIALKSSVDSLIIHGVDAKTTLKLHRIIVEDYMVIKDRILRQITIEGICKMLFSRKLTQDADHNEMEFLLSQLIIQWFDRRFNWQNSLVRQLLNVFFKSFVLFSQQRCELMMRSLAKVIFSILESKYGCLKDKRKSGSSHSSSGEKAKKGARSDISNPKKGKGKRRANESESDSEEDEDYDVKQDDSFVSDDSRCAQNQAYLETICAELDPVQITKVFLLLLSKDYVNVNAAKEFALTKDLPLEFLLIASYANATRLKKVAVVKEYIASLIDHVSLADCRDLIQLRLTFKYVEQNNKMLIQGHPKLKKFLETLERKIVTLQKEEQDAIADLFEANPASEDERESLLAIFIDKLQAYYDDEVHGTLIDLVQDNDEDLYHQQLHGLQISGLHKMLSSPLYQQTQSQKVVDSPKSTGTMSLRRRRSGLRSNKKRLMNTANDGQRLKCIPEEEYAHGGTQRDVSSSEKPPKVHAKLLNDTILEERESPFRNHNTNGMDVSIDDANIEDDIIISSANGQPQNQEERRGLMSKISKRMARDFAENKKRSILTSQASILSQQPQCDQQQRLKEEYLDKTVYKITKGRSPHRPQVIDVAQKQLDQLQELYQQQDYHKLGIENNAKPSNLSFQFDQVDDSLASIAGEKKRPPNASYEEEVKIDLKAQKKSKQAAAQQFGNKNQFMKSSKNIANNAFLAPPQSLNVPKRMTRSQMKSVSASNYSRSEMSSSEEDDESDSNGDAFDFMRSKLSKENHRVMKAAQANAKNGGTKAPPAAPLQTSTRHNIAQSNPFKPNPSSLDSSLLSEGTKKPPTRSGQRKAADTSGDSLSSGRMATRGNYFHR